MSTMSTPPDVQEPMIVLPWRRDGWTVDDLPDDGDLRYELVDGALLVSPAPGLRHDDLVAQLLRVLFEVLPDGYRAALAPGLHLDRRNYRQPDLLIYRREAVAAGRAESADALLAVEVMSPSSISTDRIVKPAQYAAAGIPHYWRVELDPLSLFVYALDGSVYREAGRYTDEVVVDAPVRVRFRLADLLP